MFKPRGPQPAAIKKINMEGLSVKRLHDFFEDAARELPAGDARFYFEQCADYFKNHYNPKRGLESASKVLGL